MKIKELKKMIKDAFIAEAEFTNAETFYEPMEEAYDELEENLTKDQIQKKYNEMFGKNPQTKFADVAKALNTTEQEIAAALFSLPMFEANEADDMTFVANLEKELAEGLTEEKLDPETKEVLYPLEDLRTQAKKSGDEKLETSLSNAITMVNKYMIMKVEDGKTLNLKALKAAIEKGDLDAFVKFQRNPYLGPNPYMAEDLYEAEEEEEVKVKVDAEEEVEDEGGEEKSDSIVVDKKIVSLSSLPNDTRKILDSLETLRAQAEEFGDQKFITQVGNTITFFTRDFVVAGDEPTKAKVDEIVFPMWNKIK